MLYFHFKGHIFCVRQDIDASHKRYRSILQCMLNHSIKLIYSLYILFQSNCKG